MSSPTEQSPPRPATESNQSTGPGGWKRYLKWDNRFAAPLLITAILLGGQLTYGMLESWAHLFLAIGAAIVVELILARIMAGKWPHLASSYISGISVAILIRSSYFWPFAMCSALSIMSKYVLRWNGRHLWNPSNFGVSAMLLLYPAAVAPLSIQWGNSIWPMAIIWTLGSVIIFRLRRFHICASYVIAFIVLAYIRSQMTGDPFAATVSPLTGPMYQLFVFFMITDPKTTVKPRWGQVLVAVLVAVVEMVLRLFEVINAPFYALFLVGPAALAVEMAWTKKQSDQQLAPVPESAGNRSAAPQD